MKLEAVTPSGDLLEQKVKLKSSQNIHITTVSKKETRSRCPPPDSEAENTTGTQEPEGARPALLRTALFQTGIAVAQLCSEEREISEAQLNTVLHGQAVLELRIKYHLLTSSKQTNTRFRPHVAPHQTWTPVVR